MEDSNVRDVPDSVIRAKALLDIARLDYLRAVKSTIDQGVRARQVEMKLRIPPSILSGDLADADRIGEPRAGFSGATPLEIAQRYAIGQISRERLIDELVRWDYVPSVPQEFLAGWPLDPAIQPEGTVREVVRAADAGLIDGATYEAIIAGIAGDERSDQR